MDPYTSHRILVVGDDSGGVIGELRASLARHEYRTTTDLTLGLEGVRAVLCYSDWRAWGKMLELVRMNMAEASPRQMAFVGFNVVERGVLWFQFFKLGMKVKPLWLRFFSTWDSWFHPFDERKMEIVAFLRRKPKGNGAHPRSSEEGSS